MFFEKKSVVLAGVEKLRKKACLYRGSLDGRCDCKYGIGGEEKNTEASGCPELRVVEELLKAMTDKEYADLVRRANGAVLSGRHPSLTEMILDLTEMILEDHEKRIRALELSVADMNAQSMPKKTVKETQGTSSKKKKNKKCVEDGMTVKELIQELMQFPQDEPVNITDGYAGIVYDRLKLGAITLFEDTDGSTAVDIGIGGCQHIEETSKPKKTRRLG